MLAVPDGAMMALASLIVAADRQQEAAQKGGVHGLGGIGDPDRRDWERHRPRRLAIDAARCRVDGVGAGSNTQAVRWLRQRLIRCPKQGLP